MSLFPSFLYASYCCTGRRRLETLTDVFMWRHFSNRVSRFFISKGLTPSLLSLFPSSRKALGHIKSHPPLCECISPIKSSFVRLRHFHYFLSLPTCPGGDWGSSSQDICHLDFLGWVSYYSLFLPTLCRSYFPIIRSRLGPLKPLTTSTRLRSPQSD